jgi:hypothetical protein
LLSSEIFCEYVYTHVSEQVETPGDVSLDLF